MEAKDVPKEKPKFAPPIARAGKTGMNKMKEGNRREVRNEGEEKTAKPSNRKDQVVSKRTSVPAPGKINTGERVMGNVGAMIQREKEKMRKAATLQRREEAVLTQRTDPGRKTGTCEKKQTPKKRGKEQGMDSGDGAAVGKKREKAEKTRSDEAGWRTDDVQKTEERDKKNQRGRVMGKGRGEEGGAGKAQLLTDTQYDEIFESVLESSTLNLMRDAKAILTEVELMQARIELETYRAEGKVAGERTGENSASLSLCNTRGTESVRETQEETLCREERSSNVLQYVLWVQCSRTDCGKWRRLSEDVDPSVLPDDWICEQNSDPVFCSCLTPEESFSLHDEEQFYYNLVPGSLVWAQQSGYPWWPAVVERDPDSSHYLEFHKKSDLTPYKCHVTYLGEPVCRSWVPCSRVKDFAALSEDDVLNTLRHQKLKKRLKDAVHMSKQALKLPLKRRLVKFGFCTRYVSERETSEEDSDIAEVLSLFCGNSGNSRKFCSDEDVKPQKQSTKLKKEGKLSLSERKRERRGIKKSRGERKGEKEREKSDQEDRKRVRKMMEKKKKQRERAENAGLEITEQKAVVHPVMMKEEKTSTPLFSLPKKKKNTPQKTGTAELQGQDQTVPQSTTETTTMIQERDTHTELKQKDGVVAEEREEDECRGKEMDSPERNEEKGGEVEGKQVVVERCEMGHPHLCSQPPKFECDDDNEGGFLDTDMEILACRDEVLKYLSCSEEEEKEEENDFSLMLFEEE